MGDTTTISKGIAAPTVNDAAEASAACTGRAVVVFEIPSSSLGNLPRKHLIDTPLDVDFGKLIKLKRRILT